MTTYRIKLVSQTNIALLIFSLLVFVFLLIATVELRDVVIPFFMGMIVLSIFLWRKFATGIALFTLSEEGISVTWEKQFFNANIPAHFFRWTDIKRIWRGADPNYYNLKFGFHSGETITYYHNGGSDDFKPFLKALYTTWNEKSKNV